jgi:Restriction endonuclease
VISGGLATVGKIDGGTRKGGRVRLVKPWEQYQCDAAALLRELGFSTQVNASLAEPNGAVHAIDVVGRRTVAGVDLLWIVECKYWNKPVPIEKVLALRSLVLDLGADRGLLMSESGFQSGAIRTANQKDITLTSLDDMRASAADEILAYRVAVAEKSLMDLSLRVNRDLRPFTLRTSHMLASLAARLPPETVEAFSARPEAIDYVAGIAEVQHGVEGLAMDDLMAFSAHPDELALPWQPGVDSEVMEGVVLNLHYTTEALYQGRLGQWPAMCVSADRGVKLAWSLSQLIDVIEPKLPDLERKVSEQETVAGNTPRLPWYNMVKPGTMPPPHPWNRGVSSE